MSAVLLQVRETPGARTVRFRCPSCHEVHAVPVWRADGHGAVWQWNGSATLPTLSPSLRTSSWPGGELAICHITVTDGSAYVYGDSTFAPRDTTLELPPWEGE